MSPIRPCDPAAIAAALTGMQAVRKVILCSGKFYYELAKARPHDAKTAIIRIEVACELPSARRHYGAGAVAVPGGRAEGCAGALQACDRCAARWRHVC